MPIETSPDPRFPYLLRMADSSLILAQRLSEWLAHAPTMEEDMALANIGLDLIGNARSAYTLAGAIEGEGRDEDRLAYFRDEREFVNLQLVEQPNRDFAATMARQFFFDAWHLPTLEALGRGSDEDLAALGAKGAKEAAYHLRHSSSWVVRLGDGTEESHRRMVEGVDAVWRYCGELFEFDEVDEALAERGWGPGPGEIESAWRTTVAEVLGQAGLDVPADAVWATGGRQGLHTEYLGYVLAEMQHLARSHPGAEW